MADELGLKLTAQVNDWVASLAKAANSADKLLKTVLELERAVKVAFQGIEAAARQGAGKAAAALSTASLDIHEATERIEKDSKDAAKAMGGIAVAADKTAKSVAKSAGDIGKSSGDVGRNAAAAATSTSSALSGVESSFSKVSTRLRDGIFSIQSALLGLGAVRFGQAAVSSASEFEAALGQVDIVAADSGKSVEELRGFLLDLSKTTPIGLVDLTKSLGDAIGKLPKGANQAATAIDALNAAQSAARASGSSAGQVLDGIIPILNTYGKTGITAAQITDKLFAAFDQGGATVPELSASLGQIVGISSQFGISIDELFGSIAVLTRGGQSASEAITNLRQALISTARPPKIVKDELEALGISADLFSAQSLKSNGLVGVLEQLQAKGGESKLEKLFTDTQGFLGVSTLLGAGLGQVREDIDLIGQSAGKTDQAVSKIAMNFDQLAGIAKNRLGAVLIQIGEKIIPTLSRVLNDLATYAETNGAAIADGIGRAVDALARFGTWVVTNGATILQWFVAIKGISFFGGLTKDILGAAAAFNTFVNGLRASAALGEGLAAVGRDGGGRFAGGFTGALKGLGSSIVGVLKSPTFLGLLVGAGVLLGEKLGAAIGDKMGEAVYGDTNRALQASIAAADAELARRYKKLGVANAAELQARNERLAGGESVVVDGKEQTLADIDAAGGDTSGAAVKGLEDLAAKQAVFRQKLEQQRANVETLREDLENYNDILQAPLRADGGAARTAAEAKARIESAKVGGSLEEREAALASAKQAAEETAGQIENLRAASQKLAADSDRIGVKAVEGVKALGGQASAAVKGAKAEQSELEKIAEDLIATYEAENAKLEELRLAGIQSGADAAQAEADARRAVFDAETDARIEAIEAVDGAEAKSADYKLQRAKDVTSIIEDQIAAIGRVAQARIEEAQSAAKEEAKAFADSAEVQQGIADKLKADKLAIETELATKVKAIRLKSAEEIAAAERDAAKARATEARAQTLTGRAQALTDTLQSPERLADIQGPEDGSGDVLGDLAIEGGAIVGAVAGIAKAVTMIPDIINGIATFLTTGIDDFAAALFDSIINVLFAVVQGLPDQIDSLLNETIPAFIEALIAAVPEIVGSLIAAIPKIIASVVKAIFYSLPKAIIGGLNSAGGAIWDFFAGIFSNVGTWIADAFGDAGQALIDGIVAVFEPIKEFFEDLGGDSPVGGDSFLGKVFSGNWGDIEVSDLPTSFASAFGKIANGDFDDLDADDIPGVKSAKKVKNFFGDLFHQGGMVNSPSSPHAAAALAMAGAPRFANGGMVTGVASLARRRLAQVLGGDDVPALLAPGEGVLTQRGVEAAGGPTGVEQLNRGNGGGAQGAQIMVSARLGGDAALAALISRIVSVSVRAPAGNVRMAIDQANRATRVPAFLPVR